MLYWFSKGLTSCIIGSITKAEGWIGLILIIGIAKEATASRTCTCISKETTSSRFRCIVSKETATVARLRCISKKAAFISG